jgi:hypothetical protein
MKDHVLLIAVLILATALAACGPTAMAYSSQTPEPASTSPSTSATPTESTGPSATPTPTESTSGSVGPTVAPEATAVPQAQSGIWLQVRSGQWQKTTGPVGTILMPFSNGVFYVVVHFPNVISPGLRASFRPQIMQPTTGNWHVEASNPPADDTLAFTVTGDTVPGLFTVQLIGPVAMIPIRLSVQVTKEMDVTLADDQQTLTMNAGQNFTLDLGEGYDWEVSIDNPAIISRDPSIPPVPGSQGVFHAARAGQTRLRASGTPPCRQAKPPCGLPSRTFTLNLAVLAVGSSSTLDVNIIGLRMFSATEGWAVGRIGDNDAGALLLTRDGGRS